MRISNKKVNSVIEKLENSEDEIFSLRTELTRPDIISYRSKKYFLYQLTNSGYQCPGTFGMLVAGFKTQKEFIKYVQEYLKNDERKKIKEEEKQNQREREEYEEYKKTYELQIKTMYDD